MAAAQFSTGGCVRFGLTAATLVAGVIASVSPAAAINCKNQYQVIEGQLLSTPYCEDNYLAKIARQYGVNVSNRTIRENPNRKAEVCRFMGFDTRVSSICQQYRDGGPSFGR